MTTSERKIRELLADEYGIMSNYELAVAIDEMQTANIGLFISRTGGVRDETKAD